ncbi:MAG: dienelactone hydrolase family protein [Rudaea sp.]
MKRVFALGLLTCFAAAGAQAAMVAKNVDYEVGGKKMQSVLVYDDALKAARPGIVMTPDWLGMNPDQVALAKQIAGKDYVILVADVYGVDVRPQDAKQAGAAAKNMYEHRADLRARINAALDQLKAQVGKAPLDGRHWGAIGFCFGGATTLDLARSGADIGGAAVFHASLTGDPAFTDKIKARILVMHGADDKFESPEQIAAFQQEMRDANADWQFMIYGGAVHCFAIPTDVGDKAAAGCKYDAPVAKRAFAQMHAFFNEVFASK